MCHQICLSLTDVDQAIVEAAKQKLLVAMRAEQRPEITLRFPFQRLPPEIRNAIYRLHLVQLKRYTCLRQQDNSLEGRALAKAYCMPYQHNPAYMPPLVEYTALSILGVSRQLHQEALGIFYYHNTLQLRSAIELRDFLSSIGPKRRAFIRDVVFDYSGTGSPAAFRLLAGCENLAKLHIQVSYWTSHTSRRNDLLGSWGVRHLLIRGLETVEVSCSGYLPQSAMLKLFEERVRHALLLPRKAIKGKKPTANSKQPPKGKNVVAGKKHVLKAGKAPKEKKAKLAHDAD